MKESRLAYSILNDLRKRNKRFFFFFVRREMLDTKFILSFWVIENNFSFDDKNRNQKLNPAHSSWLFKMIIKN